jgi:hypothetical protein
MTSPDTTTRYGAMDITSHYSTGTLSYVSGFNGYADSAERYGERLSYLLAIAARHELDPPHSHLSSFVTSQVAGRPNGASKP